MLKKLQHLSVLILLSCVSVLNAQKGTLSIEYSIGSSIPLGDFSEANSQNSGSGYANTGLSSLAGIRYQLNDGGFNVLLSAQTQANALDVAAYDRELTLLTPGSNWSVTSDIYTMSAFLAGFQQDFKVSDKTQVGVVAQLGLSFAEDPMMSLMEFNTGYWLVSSSNYSAAVAFKFGGQARVQFANNFYLTVSANYLASDHEFTNTELFFSDGDYQQSSFSKKFNTFNIQLGLAADLYKK